MRWTAYALLAALLFLPGIGAAGPTAECAPMDAATAACQDLVGKAGTSYAKAHFSAVQKCLIGIQKGVVTGDPVTTCRGTSLSSLPTDTKTADKLTKAAAKGSATIAKGCSDPQIASLQLCAPNVAGLGCLFEEHYTAVDQAIGDEFGAVTSTSDAMLQRCQSTIGKEAAKYLTGQMKALQKCLKDRNKACGKPGALPRCLAAQATGPKPEAKIVAALAKALAKMNTKIAASCSDTQVASLDACADTNADLSSCIVCSHGNGAEDQVASEYRVVKSASTSTGLQPVADTADDGDTILIEPGTYNETLELKNDGLTVLGHKTCATGARPLIDNTGLASIGISSCGSLLGGGCTSTADDQVIQSLEVDDFIDYDVYTTGADGVVYRDLVTRGPGVTDVTRYGPFPILSNNVLVENCFATRISDAAIYVGQSTNIVVRNNEVTESVAGIEIENSANAEVYNNNAHDNTAGILIFKLPDLPVQLSNCHNIHDNIAVNNNHANYGLGYLKLVPVGTGMLFLSNDTGWFHNNTITGNGTLGFAATDQGVLNLLNDPDPFSPPSPDYIPINNYIVNNTVTGNGTAPDSAFTTFAADVLAAFSPGATGNCQNGNTFATDFLAGFAGLPACPGSGAAHPPGCPYIAPTTTTSTTSTSTTILGTTTTTTLLPTFTNVYTSIFAPKCFPGCHNPGNHYGGLVLDTQPNAYANTVNVLSTEVATMNRITPSDPANSYLQHKVDGTQGSVGGFGGQMPLIGGPLSVAERDLIRAWINAGAPND